MMRLLLVGLGGFLGSCFRYLMSLGLLRLLGAAFPYGTLTVNVAGSFLMGVVMSIALHSSLIGPNLRVALTTGVLGGFTTYSAFNYETLGLMQERAWMLALLNIGATLLGCLAAGWLGWSGAAWLMGNRAQ